MGFSSGGDLGYRLVGSEGVFGPQGFWGLTLQGRAVQGLGGFITSGWEESVEVFPHSVRLSAFIIIIITIFSYTPKPYSHV